MQKSLSDGRNLMNVHKSVKNMFHTKTSTFDGGGMSLTNGTSCVKNWKG